jgi:hypothetical protein
VAEPLVPVAEDRTVHLKDPQFSAFLAWLIPGLGHLYQGRTAKGLLFFICIMGIWVYGLYLGGNSQLGYGRTAFFSWDEANKRLPYLCQVGVGLPALPALVQAYRVDHDKPVLLKGFMAPPVSAHMGANANQPTMHELNLELDRYFELGTVYTMIAGLLNVLAIYDAWGGPVFIEVGRKEENEEEKPGEANAPSPAA